MKGHPVFTLLGFAMATIYSPVDCLDGSFFEYIFGGAADPNSWSNSGTEQRPPMIPENTHKKLRIPSPMTPSPSFMPVMPTQPQVQIVVPDSTTEIPEEMPPIDIQYGEPIRRFFNNGTLLGWTSRHSEAKGTVSEIMGNCFDGSTLEKDATEDIALVRRFDHCLKFTQTYDPNYRGRYHSEVVLKGAAKVGTSAYYGFAFRLPENWEMDNNRYSIMQFITSFRDVDCPGDTKKGANPSTMVWIEGQLLFTKLRYGDPCHDGGNIREFQVGKITPGRWHTLLLGVKWHPDNQGWFKVYLDKKIRVNEKSVRTIHDTDERLYEFRVGLYPWWCVGDMPGARHPFIQPGHQATREIVIDNIGFGPHISDGNPYRDAHLYYN